MTDKSDSRISIPQLIFVPSLITLGVTLLRLIGELQHWPTRLFNPDAGGQGSIVGIAWLAPIFGVYFALKLARAGEDPGALRVIGFALVGLVVTFLGGYVGFASKAEFPGKILIGLVLIGAGVVIPFLGWKPLGKVLLAYAYAARIPVLILMYFAMRGNWHTHYDAIPPDPFPQDLPFWTKYFELAVVPQMIMWIAFTMITGMLLGGIAIAVVSRGKAAAQPA